MEVHWGVLVKSRSRPTRPSPYLNGLADGVKRRGPKQRAHTHTQILQTWVSALSWALEPECRLLVPYVLFGQTWNMDVG